MLYIHNINMVCINTYRRNDRYKYVQRQMNRFKYQCIFERFKMHDLPSKGKMISHLTTIQKYYDEYKNGTGKQYLLVLEDDIKVLYKMSQFDSLPKKWDVLYFGGRIGQKMNNWDENWIRMSSYDNHAYLLNLAKDSFITELLKKGNIYLKSWDDEEWKENHVSYNHFMKLYIHNKHKCYMMNPQMIVQAVDKSDIHEFYKNPNTMAETVNGYSIPEHYYDEDNYVLKLSNDIKLPKISLISIVGKVRPNVFITQAINNFENLMYPSELIEWNILECVEDSKDDGISYTLLGYKNINYYRIVGEDDLSVGEKMNYLIKKCTHSYIVNFDIYHHYVPQSVDARIKSLIKYDYVSCLGCHTYGVHNINKNESGIVNIPKYHLYLCSLTFTKRYWQNNKFIDSSDYYELVDKFTQNRYQMLMSLPFESVIYCLVDTDVNEKLKYEAFKVNFFDTWDEETQYVIETIKNSKNKYRLQLTPEEEAELLEDD